LVQDIHAYIQLCDNVLITHIFRQGNCVIDWLATHSLSLYSIVWNEVLHRNLLRIVYEDNLGRTLEKKTT